MTLRPKLSRSLQSSRKPKRRAGSPSTGRPMRRVALAEVKDDLSRFLRLAASEEILITRHGKPAGVLIGFDSEEDWFDDRHPPASPWTIVASTRSHAGPRKSAAPTVHSAVMIAAKTSAV